MVDAPSSVCVGRSRLQCDQKGCEIFANSVGYGWASIGMFVVIKMVTAITRVHGAINKKSAGNRTDDRSQKHDCFGFQWFS